MNLCHKPVPLPGDRFDVPRLLGVLAKRSPEPADGMLDRAYIPSATPYLLQKLFLRDDSPPVLNQECKGSERLWGELDLFGAAM
jgi:hypothetical protein